MGRELISVRLREDVLESVDVMRSRARVPRNQVVEAALLLFVELLARDPELVLRVLSESGPEYVAVVERLLARARVG